MRIIYADSMFLLNFAIDYLLLLATGKICTLVLRRWRMALAAVWGGLYAVLTVVLPEVFALASVKIFSGVAIAAIAFGDQGRFLRTAAVFLAVAAGFGGAVYGALSLSGSPPTSSVILPLSSRTLLLSFAICYAVFSLVFRGLGQRSARETGTVSLSLRGREARFRALRDTGNELRDSRGCPIVAAEWQAVAELFPELSQSQSLDPPTLLLDLSALPGMEGRCRLFPCLTATTPQGLLPCFRPDSLLINGKKAPHALVAVVPGPLSSDGSYHAIY